MTGGAGTLTGSNGAYTLDLGTLIGAQTETFSISNAAPGLADLLSGGFTVSGGAGFVNSGIGSFSGLGAGQSMTFSVTANPILGGQISETLTITPTGSNASGYSGALAPITLTIEASVPSTDFTATTETDLNNIIANIDVGGGLSQTGAHYTITLNPTGGTLSLTTALNAINLASGSSLSIVGAGGMVTIDGGSAQQGFIDQAGALALKDLTLAHMVAQGGAGASGQYGGGGGGAGLGGALYLASGASATLDNVQFIGDAAAGGAGGVYNAGSQASGGGGLDGVTASTSASGGVSPVVGGQGGPGMYANYNYYNGILIGGTLTAGATGGFGAGGGANNPTASPYQYTLDVTNGLGSAFGGGAGAGNSYNEGNGGFGGGGAGYATEGGGGGLAAGADVFVQQGATLTVLNSGLGAGALTGGAAGGGGSGAGSASAGGAAGSSIFYQGGGALTLAPTAGQVDEVDGTLASDQNMSLVVGGAGKVVLKAANSFSGGVTVTGDLELAVAGAAGGGAITLDGGAILRIDTTGAFANTVAGFAGATIDAAGIAGATVSLSGNTLTLSGGGQSLVVHLAESNLSYYGLSTASDGHGGTLVSETSAQSPVEALVTPTLSQTSFDFGNVHVGDVSSASVTVTNPLLQGGDTLVGGFGAVPQPMTGSGALTLAPGQNGSLSIGMTAINAGVTTVSAPLSLESQNPTGGLTPVTTAAITATETAWSYATPQVSASSFGAARVGGALNGLLIITNGAAAAYQEGLDYSLGSASNLTVTGAATGSLAAGATTVVGLSLSTATAGVVSATLPVGFVSDGAGTSGLGDTSLAGQTVQVSGQVYAPAVAQFANTVDLGWGHVGDTLGGTLTVTNGATGALTDTLSATWSGLGDGFVGSGAITGLAAGSSGDLTVNLTGVASGVVSTTANLALTSHDSALADLNATSGSITLTGTFLNYAQMGVSEISGGGTLTRNGNSYTLDLGAISGSDTIILGVTNTAAGLADLLSGGFDANGSIDVTASGLDSFTGLAAGQSNTAATITINPVVGGAFSETITLYGADYNQYGYSAGMPTQTITITGSFAGIVTHADPTLVSTEDQLNADIAKFSVGGSLAATNTHYVISLDGSVGAIALTGALDQISLMAGSSLTIVGNGDTLDGVGAQRGFVVDRGSVEIDNLTLANMSAQGSTGGEGSDVAGGGGGGAGLGGGLFVAGGAQVTLSGVTFAGDTAVGGAGGGDAGGNAVHGPGAGGGPIGGLPGGIGQGGAGGYAANFTDPQNGGFGGGGGGGAAQAGFTGSSGAYGGFGAGNGGAPGFSSGGGGGGGLGAGGNVFVADGGSLEVIGGSIGGGTATGGAGGVGGGNGQGLGGSVFLQGSGQISLDPTADQTIDLTGGLGTDGGGALTINGPGVVQTDGLTTLGGGVDIKQGTLKVTSDPAILGSAAITDNGAIVLSPLESGAVGATVADTQFSANDQLSLTYYDFQGNQTSQDFGWTGDLQSLADAINSAFPYGDFSAQVNGASITISSNGADASYRIADQGGRFLEKLGAASASGTASISVTGVLPSPMMQASDAIDLDGQTIVVGGTGRLSDLVSAINAANVQGVTASISGDGHLQLASPNTDIVLSDAAGTPLETLGITAGTFGATHVLSAPVSGSGSVTINQGAGDTFVISAAADWTGATTINAGTVVFGGDVSQLAGAITDAGAAVFADAGSSSLSASISGAGSVSVDVGGTFTLGAANSFTGGLTLDAGTLVLNAAGAASTGSITFGPGEATLLLGQAVTISNGGTFDNTLRNLGPTDQIDLRGLAFAAGAGAVVSGGVLTVTSGSVSYSFTLSDPGVGAFTVSNDGAGGVLLTPVGPNSLTDTAQDITANLSSLLSNPGLDFITVSDNGPITLTVSQALSAGDIGRLHNQDGGAVRLEVVDTADNIAAHLAALEADAHVVSLTATSASAQAALALRAVALTTPITAVRDSAGDLSGAVLGQLQAIGVTAVTVQDGAPVVLSLAQFEADAAILSGLAFAGGQTAGVVEISDSADNVASQLPALSADPRIASVVISADGYNGNVLIQDSSQPLTLNLSGGGVITMNPADSGVAKVVLTDPPSPYVFTADSEPGLQIVDQNTGPDVIVVGDPSQSATFDYAGSTVQATAANAGVLVQGAGAGDILEITTGGVATLNPGDSDISVVLDQASTLTLAPGVFSVTGSGGDDVFVATQAQMRAGFSLDGGAGANTLQLSGGGTFDLSQPAITNVQTLVAAESQNPSAQQIVDLRPGTTLQIDVATPALDPSNANAAAVTIVGAATGDALNLGGAGGVVTLQAAPGGAVASTAAATLPTLGDTMTLTFSDSFVGTVTKTFAWDGSLDDLASAINGAFAQAFLGSFGYANITATSHGSSLTLTANADTDFSLTIDGALAGELNGPTGAIDNAFAGITYSLTPMFSASDAIDLNGTVVTVGGVGSLHDLAAAINGAGIGVTAGIDAGGHLTLVSTTGHVALADASGTPLEDLGVASGLYANATTWGSVSGAGEAVIQQLATDNTVISGAVTATGGIDLVAGTLTFQGDVSGMAGLLTDDGAVAFDESGSTLVSAVIGGSGAVVVNAGGVVTLSGANSFTGGLTLRSGTLVLAGAGAASTGDIAFGGAATLVLGGGIAVADGGTFANTIDDFGGASLIDIANLAYVDGASARLAGGVLTLTSGAVRYSLTLASPTATAAVVTGDGAGGVLVAANTMATFTADALQIAANLDALDTDPNLTTITVTDNQPLTLTAAQVIADAAAIARLHNSDGSPVALRVVDTAADITANFDALSADAQVSAIVLTGASGLTLNAAQYAADTAGLAHLSRANGQTTATVELVDTPANIAAVLPSLGSDPRLADIVAAAHAGDAGVLLQGGADLLALKIYGGGVSAMNAGDTGVGEVLLMPSATPAIFTANGEAGLIIIDDNTGSTADTIVLGAASQTVYFQASGGTVKAAAAFAGAFVPGVNDGGSGVTLEITGGGVATLNARDTGVHVLLDQATDLTLNARVTHVVGSAGDDTIRVTSAQLPGLVLDGGGGTNTLAVRGAGTIDLNQPGLTNFQVISIAEGQYQSGTVASTYPTVRLASGHNYTVNVLNGVASPGNTNTPGVTLYGANDSDVINLGAGADLVTLGSAAETVNGGAGLGTIQATAATAGALLKGGSGGLTLNITGGGVASLNAGDSGLVAVNLRASGGAFTFTANGQAGLLIQDLNTYADTVVVGAASDTVLFSASGATAQATAALAGAVIKGASDGRGGDTLEITTAGVVTLNAGDARIGVVLDQGVDLTLNAYVTQVTGGAGNDTVRVNTTQLPALNFNGGGGTNTLVLQGVGTFDLSQPTLANIQVISVSEGQYHAGALASTYQTVYLRAGQSATVNVQSIAAAAGNTNTPGVTLYGANDSDVINLGAGADLVTLGSAAETVNGGAGLGTIQATATTAGALLKGGSGGLTLNITGGGVASLNAGDSGLAAVNLRASGGAFTFTANVQTSLWVNDLNTYADIITASAARQTITGGAAGQLTMIASAAGGDTFRDSASLINGDTIKGFAGAGNIIDVTDLTASKLTATFTENAAGTAGQLNLTDGTHSASITLFGQFMAAGFSGTAASAGFTGGSDGASGTNIAYHPVVAPPH